MKKKYSLFTLLVGTCLCSLSAYAVPTDIATPITQEINQKSKKQNYYNGEYPSGSHGICNSKPSYFKKVFSLY